MSIREPRGSVDVDFESAHQLLDAQMEGTTTWEVHDACDADSFVHARKTFRPGRASMHASVSVEYKCDVY